MKTINRELANNIYDLVDPKLQYKTYDHELKILESSLNELFDLHLEVNRKINEVL